MARLLLVISAGGVLGSLTRYALSYAYPHSAAGFPWATFAINVTGCLLIGVLMVLVTEVWPGRPLLRPFLGVGVLGGYTTFSAYVVDIVRATDRAAMAVAGTYLLATPIGAMMAVWAATVATRWVIRPRATPREVR
jgi:CrcB protein